MIVADPLEIRCACALPGCANDANQEDGLCDECRTAGCVAK